MVPAVLWTIDLVQSSSQQSSIRFSYAATLFCLIPFKWNKLFFFLFGFVNAYGHITTHKLIVHPIVIADLCHYKSASITHLS